MRVPRTGRFAGLLVGLALVATVAACGTSNSVSSTGSTSSAGGGAASPKGAVTIGAFNFGESRILAQAYAQVLAKAGYTTTIKELGNREIIQPALQQGQLDVVPEYLSTLTEFLNGKANGPNAAPLASADVAKTFAALKTLATPRGLTPLTPSPATDQNAFAVTKDFATKNKLTTLSDLAGYPGGPVALGGPPECPQRPFCQPGLEKTYGLKISKFVSLDAGGPLTKKAIQNGTVTLGLVFSSDGGIDALGLQVLTDDKGLQNADNILPVVRTARAEPTLTAALDGVSAKLTTEQLIRMNKQVDIDRADPADVAKAWLAQQGLA